MFSKLGEGVNDNLRVFISMFFSIGCVIIVELPCLGVLFYICCIYVVFIVFD